MSEDSDLIEYIQQMIALDKDGELTNQEIDDVGRAQQRLTKIYKDNGINAPNLWTKYLGEKYGE